MSIRVAPLTVPLLLLLLKSVTVEALFNFAAESELSHKLDRRVEDFPAKKKRRDGAFGKMIGDRQQHDFHILYQLFGACRLKDVSLAK